MYKKINFYYVEKQRNGRLAYTYLASTNSHKTCKSAKESAKRVFNEYPFTNMRCNFA